MLIVFIALALFAHPGQAVYAQVVKKSVPSQRVQFSFNGAPWRTVIEWLAESGNYALHVNDVPLGSFTYSDKRFYTHDEAINRINMFLIPQRYTIVRSENLLSVISLVDETSVRQLDSMAKMVTVAELKNHDSHELVKCLFPLGNTASDHAIEELSGLMLMLEPIVLNHSNQLMVTDTAGKLRLVAKVLTTLAKPHVSAGPVKRFALGDLDPEQVLAQVRPHVKLDPLAMIGADVQLSIDKDRRQLLASGSDENLQAIASVITLLQQTDVPAIPSDELIFRTHDVKEAEMQTVVNVLQTLLAEEDVRLAPDAKSNQLAILATERVHELVDKTIKELIGTTDSMEFKAISVTGIDARYAAVVLNDMFASKLDSTVDINSLSDTPRIVADSVSGRLFVRARKSQIEEIERALMQFNQPTGTVSAKLRLFPYHGERARSLLDSARKFWPYEDRIEVVPSPNGGGEALPLEREIKSKPRAKSKPLGESGSGRKVTSTLTGHNRPFNDGGHHRPREFDSSLLDVRNKVESVGPFSTEFVAAGNQDGSRTVNSHDLQSPPPDGAARIRVQLTPSGILIHSDNADALKRFEKHLGLITGSNQGSDRKLAVFYLKHEKIKDANALLRELLADEARLPAGLGRLSLPQDVIDATGNLDQSWRYDTATVIPDIRLNRFFVYGLQSDLAAIEEHLKVIDRESSIAPLKMHGTPRIVPLYHAKAEAVATVIRDTYSGRIASSAKERSAATSKKNQNQQRPSSVNQKESDIKSDGPLLSSNVAAKGDEDKMTLAVDIQSNSIVVTAPSQLADEVETLARAIDKDGQKTVQFVPLNDDQALRIQNSLNNLFGDRVRTGAVQSKSSKSGVKAK